MKTIDDWIIAALTPLELLPNAMPTALARAGALLLIDAVSCTLPTESRALATLQPILDSLPRTAAAMIGVRLRAVHCAAFPALLALLQGRAHWLVLAGWDGVTVADLPAAADRSLWLEITSCEQLGRLPTGLPIAGLIGVGAECGGDTGREGAFVLAQGLARQPLPFLVRGAVDCGAAAACRVAGAAGVVCDDTLLLLRESPLGAPLAGRLSGLGGADTRLLGEELGRPARILLRPDFPGSDRLAAAESAAGATATGAAAWEQALAMGLGWEDPARRALPVGEGLGLAGAAARRDRTVGRHVTALRCRSARQVAQAARDAALAPGGPLAGSLGIALPIVQGPMTRVSDRSELAMAVAAAGGLPLIAAAMLSPAQLRPLLEETGARLADRPWGVGLLGFVTPALREAQFALVEALRPPCALISGGTPEQAARLEQQGIATWLHVPAPLIEEYCARGVRRFVFEGAECGGHVGPLHAFALWQEALEHLLAALPAAELGRLEVLFAGGIHDARSAAMVAALAAPLTAAGARIGVLMGTAYLFTTETVAAGALAPLFQELARQAAGTRVIETGPGHRIRCAHTPFVERFARERATRLAGGEGGRALSDALEDLTRGRARIAAKGLLRRGGELVELGAAEHLQEGLFMLGEVATLHDETMGIEALHAAVAAGSVAVLQQAAAALLPASGDGRPADVAIIGAACWLPGATGVDAFWINLLARTNAIGEVPLQRWDWRLYYGPDAAAPDRITAKWGGFVDTIPFDPLAFGIPPKSLAAITPAQLAALELCRRALSDAGLGERIEDAELRARTSVVIGVANTADLEQCYVTRSTLPLVTTPTSVVWERLPQWSEESLPGMLRNVVAGRVANRFDLGGINLAVDAACASSLAALDLAVRDLAEGRSDLVLAGGIDLEMSPHAFLGFSHSQALSPRGRAEVFDTDADGIVISEGAVMLVLKRLAEAERDGDRIYAVIRAVAGSSDGRGLSLTAPKPLGQRRAVERAWCAAGLGGPAGRGEIGLYEAHGTGTPLGDGAELETIDGALRGLGVPPGSCALGSVKGLIGHTRSAAGLTGVLKAALALHYRVLPPHSPVRSPLPLLGAADTPLRLLDQAYPWPAPAAGPRRAAVSAFGFGGTNFHALLEEWRPGPTAPDARPWPWELFLLGAAGPTETRRRLDRLAAAAERLAAGESAGEMPPVLRLRDLAASCAHTWGTTGAAAAPQEWRVALIADSAAGLLDCTRRALAALDTADRPRSPAPAAAGSAGGVWIGSGPAPGGLAFVFPGQGAQYPGMGAELALYCPELAAAVAVAERELAELHPALRTTLWPPAAHGETGEAHRRTLAATALAQPALAALGCGLLDLAARLGLQATACAGHSFGEFLALHAAGAIGRADLLRLAAARGAAMSAGAAGGGMAAVAGAAQELAPLLTPYHGVVVANRNAPRQTVISGPRESLGEAIRALETQGFTVQPLAVSAAFHSPAMADAAAVFAEHLAAVALEPPTVPVFGNLDGHPYPTDPDRVRARLRGHMLAGVDFLAQVEQMYAAGIRTFVELGPARVLSGLIGSILGDACAHLVLSADGGLRAWLELLAQLHVHGHAVQAAAVFAGRDCCRVALEAPLPAAPRDPGWCLDGGQVRPRGEPTAPGRRPFLDLPGAARESAGASRELPDAIDTRGLTPVEQAAYVAYREYGRTMQRFLDQQELALAQLLSLSKAAQAPALLPAPAPTSPTAPAASPATGAAAPLTPAEIGARLVALISERTGYPREAIGLEQDLEGDLGIDSIKRVEIAVAFQKSLPPALAAGLDGRLETLATRRTVAAMLAVCGSGLHAAPAADVPAALPHATGRDTAAPGDCPRWLPHCVPLPPPVRRRAGLSGLILVSTDRRGIAVPLLEHLRACGAAAYPLRPADLLSDEALDRRHGVLRLIHGPVRGIIHLAALDGGPVERLADWRQGTDLACKRLFRLLQLCATDFARGADAPRVIAVSALGGRFGRGCADLAAVPAGGQHGLLRTLVQEYPAVQATTVDLDPTLAPDTCARLLLDEVLAEDGEPEIGYPGGDRHGVRYLAPPRANRPPSADWEPRPGWVVLATGGARGITAEVLARLRLNAVRLILVGRGPAPAAVEPTAITALESQRQRLLVELRSGTGRAAEVLETELAGLEATLRGRRRDLECRRGLERLEACGAHLEYHRIDVRDEVAFGGLIADLYHRFGRIDAVLHGAGVIEDQRLARKSAAGFARVFDTKADGLYLLARHLRPAGLRWLVCFSSVAGRYGNPGQADYAAANEVLNRFCWVLRQRWPETRISAINWGPWSGVGMADEAALRLLAGRGITAITPDQGGALFTRELGGGTADQVEVIAGQGPWAEDAGLDRGLAQLLVHLGTLMAAPAACGG